MDILKNKVVPFLLLMVVFPGICHSQIQGTINDRQNQPLSFANVILISQKDSSVVTGMMASDVGTFSITNFTPGKYLIKTSLIGYKTTLSEPFEMKSANEHLHINPIIVEEETKLLGDVDVVAKKPIYELQIDRMVVNVENSITSTGTTALEILEKSPGVLVDRQNITLSMGGKTGVLVMINGKENRMQISTAIEMLNGMSSANVKKIELITTPPSKYEAEGNAGIINIVLKKDDDFGTNGTYSLSAGMSNDEKLNGSITLNHHVKKVNYFGMYSNSYNNASSIWNSYKKVTRDDIVFGTNAESSREPIIKFQNFRIGLDYTISSKTEIGFLTSGYVNNWEMDAINEISYTKDKQITSLVDQQIHEINKWDHLMGNFNVLHHFREDEILEFNADYLYYYDNNPSCYLINYHDKNGIFTSSNELRVTKKTPIRFLVGKLDYSRSVGKKVKIESGLKSAFYSFGNDVSLARLENGNWTFDRELTNEFSLDETISAAYSSANFNFSEKTSLIIGLRFEYTTTVLSTKATHGIVDRQYGKLFPTFFFSHELFKDNTIQFSYSRRINRPTFNELAPFIIFQSPTVYITGNDKLEPSIDDVFKIDCKYKSILVSFTGSNEKMAIRSYQPGIDQSKDVQFLMSRNHDHVGTSTLLISFPLKLAKWWNMQTNLAGMLQNVRTDYDGEKLDLSLRNFRANAVNNFKINERINCELSAAYQSAEMWGINKSKSYSSVSIGFQAKSKNQKSTLSLNLSDVFKGYRWTMEANVPALNINSLDYYTDDSRILRLTYTHNFGNNKVKAERTRETGSEEERNRVN
jgi:hypothetical protein